MLRAAISRGAGFPAVVYLGLAFEGMGELDSAVAAYDRAKGLAASSNDKAALDSRLAAVTRARLSQGARRAIAAEARLSGTPAAPNTIAVLPWTYIGASEELRPLERGIAHLVVTDLSKVSSLVLLERERVQALVDELSLTTNQRVEPATGARSGRLLRAGRVVQGALREQVRGGDLRLEARVVNATSGDVAGTGMASDRLQQLFAMEKRVVLALLEQMRITLSPAERQAIAERPTADLQAFLAFSRGLEAEDRGDFLGASQQFQAAATRPKASRRAGWRRSWAAASGPRVPIWDGRSASGARSPWWHRPAADGWAAGRSRKRRWPGPA
jgi:TolB-like protein